MKNVVHAFVQFRAEWLHSPPGSSLPVENASSPNLSLRLLIEGFSQLLPGPTVVNAGFVWYTFLTGHETYSGSRFAWNIIDGKVSFCPKKKVGT
jgi:hypothetical protein